MRRMTGFLALLALSGCTRMDSGLESRIAALEARIEKLTGDLAEQSQFSSGLKTLIDLQRLVEAPPVAETSATATGYAAVTTAHHLVLFISIEKVEPYAGGYRLDLRVGNPTSASLTGAKVGAECGGRDGPCRGESDIVTLRPGAWTRVAVPIGPANAPDLNTLRLWVVSKEAVLAR